MSQPWHDEARRMRAADPKLSVPAIARVLGKSKTATRVVLDPEYAQRQMALSKDRKRKERDLIRSTQPVAPKRFHEPKAPKPKQPRHLIAAAIASSGERPITLPTIKILLTQPEPERPRLRFAPKVRVKEESPGVRRWREIHEAMIRRGVLHVRGLIEELHR